MRWRLLQVNASMLGLLRPRAHRPAGLPASDALLLQLERLLVGLLGQLQPDEEAGQDDEGHDDEPAQCLIYRNAAGKIAFKKLEG